MRIIIQRVREARVTVTDAASGAAGEERTVGEIGPGLCVLVGVTHTDGVAEADKALPLFNRLAEQIPSRGVDTETGEFGAHMNVYLTNDGPFTIFYEV